LPKERQGELFFRYMKGVYRLFDWFSARFPNAVIETCSGGGGRYDLGMMPYGIQIWTSDNTNPYDRTMIQASALIAYPAATMSCHVSNPHENLRSLDYRYKVAVGGMLGYELNILNMSEEVKRDIAAQIAQYKSFEHLMRAGDYYCLAAPYEYDYSAYYYATPDASELLLTVIEKAGNKKPQTKRLKLKAADPEKTYVDCQTKKQYSGAELRDGLAIDLTCDYDSAHLLHFKAL
jgi:alpha-galactosidase